MTIESAYRRLATVILGLDVATLAVELRAERKRGLAYSRTLVVPDGRLVLIAIPQEEVMARQRRVA